MYQYTRVYRQYYQIKCSSTFFKILGLIDLYRKYECYKMDLIIELNHDQEALIKTDETTKNEIWQIIDKLNTLITEVKKIPNKELPNQIDEINSFLYYKKYVEASNMHKVNLLFRHLNYNYRYPIETPTNILIAITNLVPEFSSAYIKIAEIMKITPYRTSIYPHYMKALNSKKNAPFLSETYLDIKKLIEKRLKIQAYRSSKDQDNLKSYCQKAFELDPLNCRAYFQYASLMVDFKKYQTAINNYEKIINITNSLSPLEQLSPIELNYFLRSRLLIGIIHGFYWSDDLTEKQNINKGFNLREKYLENNLISKYYFSDDPSDLKKKLLTKTKYLDDNFIKNNYV